MPKFRGFQAAAVGAALCVHWAALEGVAAASRFSVTNDNGAWLLVSPAGRPFFSLGVSCVQPGPVPEDYDPENPAYAAWQHYPNLPAWRESTVSRLQQWGFTTLGGWSDLDQPAGSHRPLWITPVLGLGAAAGAPWWDMWDEANVRTIQEVASAQILPHRGDRRVIGYYSDNELGWWNAALWKATLEQPPSSGQRRQLVTLLRQIYGGDWRRLSYDFEPEHVDGFEGLDRSGMLFLRPGGHGVAAMRRFLELIADRYYGLMRDTIRRYDPEALYLGDRYPSFFYPEVARAAGRYVDAVSCNLNAHWSDGTFLRCFLSSLSQTSGKPVLVSEFYAASAQNRSGNRNDYGVFPVLPTQKARARAAQKTLESIALTPQTIGADWFQFADEPKHGRDDGENFNFGLVDIHDAPYAPLAGVFSRFDVAEIRRSARARLDASSGVPRAPARPFDHFKPPEALREWDRERGFVKPAPGEALADLYIAWSPHALYLGLYSLEIVEPAYYRNPFVPKIDRTLLTVRIDGREAVRTRLGSGREPLTPETRVRIENSSSLGNNVSNVAALEIPAEVLDRKALHSGESIRLETTLVTHGGAARVEWSGDFTLR